MSRCSPSERQVLDALKAASALSVPEAASMTGLKLDTAYKAMDRLCTRGLVMQIGQKVNGAALYAPGAARQRVAGYTPGLCAALQRALGDVPLVRLADALGVSASVLGLRVRTKNLDSPDHHNATTVTRATVAQAARLLAKRLRRRAAALDEWASAVEALEAGRPWRVPGEA